MKHKLLLILLTFVSASVFGQAWQDGANGVQFRYVGDKREIRQLIKSPQPPYGVTDSLAKLEALINKKDFLSTGLIDHAALSATVGQTTFNISAGRGVVANFNNHFYPSIKRVTITAKTGITPAFLTTGIASYIAIDSNDNVVQSASPFTDTQSRDLIILGAIIHSNLTNINAVNNIAKPIISNTNQLHDLYEAVGALNTAGNKYTANGANLNIDKSAGNLFKLGVNFVNDWKSPSKLTLSAQTGLTFRYRTQTGTEFSDRTTIDPGFYDAAGTRTAIPGSANQFTIQRITIFQSGLTRIQYGQNLFANKAEAIAALGVAPFVTETNIAENGIFRAYLVVRANATALNDLAQAEFIEVGKFGSPIGNAGGAVTSDNIIAALGYAPENVANKATDFTTVNNTLYPTVQATKAYADGLVVGLLNDRGSYNASSNLYPSTGGSGTAGAIMKGNLWAVSVAGTLGGVPVTIGDWLRALVDSPGQTASNWSVVEGNFGYVPDNVANKQNSLDTDGTNTKYPTVTAVNSGISAVMAALNTKEDVSNKQNSLAADPSNNKYPTVTAVNAGLATKASSTIDLNTVLTNGNVSALSAQFGGVSAPVFTGNLTGNAATSTNSTNWNGYGNQFSTGIQSSGSFTSVPMLATNGFYYNVDATPLRTFLGSPSGGETLQSVTDRGQNTNNPIATFDTTKDNALIFNSEIYNIPYIQGANSTQTVPKNIAINPDGGNVNVGYTTDQGYKLAVNGALTATSYTGGATLTGTTTAPTPTAGDNSTKIATTAFVMNTVSSGTYTPTLTAGSNVSSISNAGVSHYSKNGNEVTVFGSLTVTPTAGVSAGTNTVFSISLPIASDFTNGDDLFGHGSTLYNNGGNNVSYSSSYVASPANNDCSGAVMAFATNAITIRYSFMYTIK